MGQKGKSSKTTDEEKRLLPRKLPQTINERVGKFKAKVHMVEGEPSKKEG